MSEHDQPQPPLHQLGDFRIVREIGRGGMGIVYEAEQVSLGRRIALKVLPAGMLDTNQKRRFEREARAAAKLHHTNIVPIFGVGEQDGIPYYAMQLVQGRGLDQLLAELRRQQDSAATVAAAPRSGAPVTPAAGAAVPVELPSRGASTIELLRGGPVTQARTPALSPPGAVEIGALRVDVVGIGGSGPQRRTWWHAVARVGIQVGGALEHAHKQGIIHRDVKPGNLLLDERGTVWVTDFGLAKANDQQNLTLPGDVLGTLRYLPPEAFEGKADARGDVYALGLTLYELIALRPAFAAKDQHQLIKKVTSGEPIALKKVRADVPRDLETIVSKAIDRDPDRRYQTAGALATDLQRFLDDEPIQARRTSARERLARWARRRPGLAAALAAIALILVAGTVASSIAAVRFGTLADEKETARIEADVARCRAELASDRARERGDAERWERYRSNMAAAASAMQMNNSNSARRALEAAPEEHRGWEWLHFHSRLDGARTVLRGHEGEVVSVAIHPAGKMLAASTREGTIHLWDMPTGKPLDVWRGPKGPTTKLLFRPDGKQLASWCASSVCLWDVATGRQTAVLPGRRSSHAELVYSPDGRFLASAGGPTNLSLWDGQTGKEHACPGEPWNYVLGLAFHPDGKLLASAAVDNMIRFWDVATGKEVRVLKGHTAPVRALAFSPDGNRLVSGGSFPENALRLWDVETGAQLTEQSGHRNQIVEVAFSADGRRIASASMDQTARLWDGLSGQPVARLLGHTGYLTQVLFRPGDKTLLTASADQTLRLWDATTGDLIAVLRGHSDCVESAATSPDGALVASAGRADGTVRLWDMAMTERNGVLRGHNSYVYDVAFRPDGAEIASAAWDHTVRFWDAATGKETRALRHDQEIVTAVVYSRDGRLCVSVARENAVKLWDLTTGKLRHKLAVSNADWRLDMRPALNAEGTLIAAGSNDGNVHLWDAVTGAALAELKGHEGGCSDVVFHPNGAQLASTGVDGLVRLWDVKSRTLTAVLQGHKGFICRLAHSADGRLLASAGVDKTVRIWDLAKRQQLKRLAHGSTVYGVAFSPDGARLAAACADNTIRLWDVGSWEEVAELHGHTDYVHAVAFSPDSTCLVSGSGDGTVRIWDTVSPQVRARPKDAYVPPRHYVCYRASGPIQVDGRLDEDAWKAVPWTEDFTDIEGDLRIKPRYRTRVKMLWDDKHFYVAAELEEPHVWGTLTQHDSVIFHDNDFEVFIDPDGDNHNYAEFEINALNTGWDLLLRKPYRDGGPAENSWEIPGLKTAVFVDGTLNDPRDTDKGWTVEMAFPWEVLGKLSPQPAPPRDGDQWRVNFSRVEWRHNIVDGKYEKVKHRREDNWVWSPQGAIDMHRPEMWGYVQFSTAAPGQATFRPDPAGPARHLLHRIYYAQRAFLKAHKQYAGTLADLGLAGIGHDSLTGPPTIDAMAERFEATADVRLPNGGTQRWRIREDSRIGPVEKADK